MKEEQKETKNNIEKTNKKTGKKNSLKIIVQQENENVDELFNNRLLKISKVNNNNENFVNPKLLKKFTRIETLINKYKKNISFEDENILENLPFKKERDSLEIGTSQVQPNINAQESISLNQNQDEIYLKNQSISKYIATSKRNSSNLLNSQNKDSILDTNLKPIIEETVLKTPLNNLSFDDNYESFPRIIRKFQNVYDSFSDDEIVELSPKDSKFLIMLNSQLKKIWDYFMIIIIFYSSLLTPYILCFDDNKNDKWLYSNELVFEIIFLLDIALNFFVPFIDKNENLVTNHNLIFENYLSNYFLLDFICAIPFNLTYSILGTQLIYAKNIDNIFSFCSNDFILKWVLLFRLVKVVKYEFLEDLKFLQDFQLNRILKSGVIFIYLSHISTCIWIQIGKCNYTFNNNWIVNNSLNEFSNYDLYIASAYFNFVTIFTIGYGDIVASNLIERLYNIFLLIFGVMLYTFAVTNISSIFTSIDDKKVAFIKNHIIIDEIYRDYNVDYELYKSIKQNLNIRFKRNYEDRYELLDNLPSHVKNYLTTHMYKRLIKDLKFFKDQTYDFILFVLPFLKSHVLERNELLFSVGEVVEEMYLVVSGVLAIQLGDNYDNLEIGLVNANSHFGELFLQTNEISPYELKCKTKYAEILVLKKQDFIKVKNAFNQNIIKTLRESFKTLEVIEKRRHQFLRLYHYENSVEGVKTIIRRLNMYLMEKGFDDYYNEDKDFKEANDFIIENDFKYIMRLLQSNFFQGKRLGTSHFSKRNTIKTNLHKTSKDKKLVQEKSEEKLISHKNENVNFEKQTSNHKKESHNISILKNDVNTTIKIMDNSLSKINKLPNNENSNDLSKIDSSYIKIKEKETKRSSKNDDLFSKQSIIKNFPLKINNLSREHYFNDVETVEKDEIINFESSTLKALIITEKKIDKETSNPYIKQNLTMSKSEKEIEEWKNINEKFTIQEGNHKNLTSNNTRHFSESLEKLDGKKKFSQNSSELMGKKMSFQNVPIIHNPLPSIVGSTDHRKTVSQSNMKSLFNNNLKPTSKNNQNQKDINIEFLSNNGIISDDHKKDNKLRSLKRSKTKLYESIRKKVFDENNVELLKEENDLNVKTMNLINLVKVDKKSKNTSIKVNSFLESSSNLNEEAKGDNNNLRNKKLNNPININISNAIDISMYSNSNIESNLLQNNDKYFYFLVKSFQSLNPDQKDFIKNILKLDSKTDDFKIQTFSHEIIGLKPAYSELVITKELNFKIDQKSKTTNFISKEKISVMQFTKDFKRRERSIKLKRKKDYFNIDDVFEKEKEKERNYSMKHCNQS